MFVARPRHAALQARYQQILEERDTAVKLAAERLSTVTRQAEEITRLRGRKPDAPLPYARALSGDAEVRRQLHLARRAMAALDERLTGLQTVNEAQALELRAYADKTREVSAS